MRCHYYHRHQEKRLWSNPQTKIVKYGWNPIPSPATLSLRITGVSDDDLTSPLPSFTSAHLISSRVPAKLMHDINNIAKSHSFRKYIFKLKEAKLYCGVWGTVSGEELGPKVILKDWGVSLISTRNGLNRGGKHSNTQSLPHISHQADQLESSSTR